MKLSKCFGWDEEINNLKVEREVWKAVIEQTPTTRDSRLVIYKILKANGGLRKRSSN